MSSPVEEITCKARLLMCSVDLARASVLNINQFNGKYGCSQCEDEGQPRPSSHLVRNCPYSSTSVMRTHLRVIANAKEALWTRTCELFIPNQYWVFKNCALHNIGDGNQRSFYSSCS